MLAVQFYAVQLQCEHMVIMLHNLQCHVRIIRIICKPDRRLYARLAYRIDLLDRDIHPVQHKHQVRAGFQRNLRLAASDQTVSPEQPCPVT